MRGIVAFQGSAGAYGEEACRRFLPDHARLARPSFDAVARAVAGQEADLGMLPRTNSIAGPVPGIEALIAAHDLDVAACHPLAVRLHLLAAPGVSVDEIRIVASHPMALAQCGALIARRGWRAEEAANTAGAAQALGKSMDRHRAVVASEAAAAAHGLEILVRDVQDRPDNVTLFCVVARKQRKSR